MHQQWRRHLQGRRDLAERRRARGALQPFDPDQRFGCNAGLPGELGLRQPGSNARGLKPK
jgi:hypothetical protein